MRFPVRSMTLAACCAAAASAACSITDQSDQVFVVVHPSDSLLAHGIVQRGQRDTVYAEAFRRTGADSQRLPNVEFLWSTNDKNVATVENVGNGAAVITGVNAGFGTVSAQAVNFERSKSGNRTIRVAPPFIIDSVRPLAVRYGDKLSVYGVGIGNISVLELGFADLIRDDYSFTGSPNGVARQDYWVPFPSTTDLPVYGIFGGGQFFAAQLPDTVAVDSVDLFEPDSSSPAVIDINGAGGPRTVAGLPSLFFNPALYFEPVSSGGSAVDWQRFDRNDNAPVTIIVNSQVYGDTSFAYISDSLYSLGGGGG